MSLNQIVCFLMFYFYNSGMYYDEDGDLAEEFYEEVTPVQGTPGWDESLKTSQDRFVHSGFFRVILIPDLFL